MESKEIMKNYHTYNEIKSQPQAWAETLDMLARRKDEWLSFFKEGNFDSVILTGCGSMYYMPLAAAVIWQELTKLPTRALPGSETWLNPGLIPAAARPLLIAVSRSGTTTETIRATRAFGGKTVTVSCYPEAELPTIGSFNLLVTAGQETSVAQTRAFSTLYLATLTLAVFASGRDDLWQELQSLPALAEKLINRYEPLAEELGKDLALDRFYFLGSGLRYGLACEVNLKMKEMTLTHSEPFHILEYRHGPKAMVTPSALVVGLLSDAQREQEEAVLKDMRLLGGRTLSIAESGADVELDSGLSEIARSLLYLPIPQLIAFQRSVAKGLNPDQPENLTAVVELA
jgi:glucosamine--fructose-6-phosphate aminotransferase (isomerizing)